MVHFLYSILVPFHELLAQTLRGDFLLWKTQLFIGSSVLLAAHHIAYRAVKDVIFAWLDLKEASADATKCPAPRGPGE